MNPIMLVRKHYLELIALAKGYIEKNYAKTSKIPVTPAVNTYFSTSMQKMNPRAFYRAK